MLKPHWNMLYLKKQSFYLWLLISKGNSRQVVQWFNKEKPSLSKVSYTILGSKIKFSTTSSYGTVDYQGEIKEESLILNSYSHINGHKATYNFFFMKLKLR
jgi:hypothetical protein